jgi:hypothetical protein
VKAKLRASIEQGRENLSGSSIEELRIHAIRRLTEQRPIESIAKDDPDPDILEAAVQRLDSLEIVAAIAAKEAAPGVKWQAELRLEILRRGEAGIANLLMGLFEKAGGGAGWLLRDPSLPESWDLHRAMRAVDHIRDAALLEKLAGEAPHPVIRRSAAEALDDQAALARLVSASEDGEVRQLVAGKIDIDRTDDPAVLRAVARAAYSTERKAASIARIADPTARAECVVGKMDPVLRAVALLGVAHDALLCTLEKTPLVRETAILLLQDQEKLRALATDEPRATIRRTAVLGLSDDGFLLKRLELDPSPAVRAAAVRSLHETSSLLAAVRRSYHADVRAAAFSRLGEIKDEVSLAQARAAQEDIVRRTEACRALEDAAALVGSALGGGYDVVCRAAADRLEAPEALLRIACEATDRGVLKAALGKIADRDALAAVSLKAADAAMRLAAEQKAGRRSWEDIFRAAAGDVRALGDSVAAVALFGEALKGAAAAVQQACLDLIRLGDESRIPEMVDLLELYGDRTLCEDYLNCEQPDLGAAGRAWAEKRGYTIRSGSGSSRASWGEGR